MNTFIIAFCFLIGVNIFAWDYWKDCKLEEIISEACRDEFSNIDSKTLHKPVLIKKDRIYKNWRAGFVISNIPENFALMMYQAPWSEVRIQMYIYNEGKKVAKINAALLSLGDREPINRGCEIRISDLFSPMQFKEIEDCSFEIVRKDYRRNIAIGYSIDVSIKEWFDENFKIMKEVE